LLSVVAQALLLLYIFCVQVRIFLLLLVMSMRAVNGRSRLIRARFPTGTHRHRWSRKAFFSRARRMFIS
jgi:hypothetical protein